MTQIRDLVKFLEETAPLFLQESYDNSGLITGKLSTEIQSVLISLDTTEEVIDEAIQKNSNLIVSHHPIVFKGLKKLCGDNYVERTIIKAIKNDIAIYAIHTNLDNVLKNGVNTKICERLNIKPIRALSGKEIDKTCLSYGTGILGELEVEMKELDFLKFVKEQMKTPLIKYTMFRNKSISKVAVCGGSGAFLINQAIGEGADAFISADFKYHDFFEADQQILLADIGHFESEQFTIDLLYELITKKFSNFAARKTKVVTNPIQYL